jgi:adenylyl-sulfate kinase
MTTLLKSISYRIVSSLATIGIAWWVTGSTSVAVAVGVADTVFKIALYWCFDYYWTKWTTKNYKPSVVWLTGLSGAGKTTIAKALWNKLLGYGHSCMVLDGDEIRHIFPGTGFDEESRKQHILKVGQIAAFLQSRGITAIVSLISPYREPRDKLRSTTKNFLEVHVSTPLYECEKRDPKGLYKRARAGEIKQFTGIDAPYEWPLNPDVELNTTYQGVDKCVEILLRKIQGKKEPLSLADGSPGT